MNDTEKDNLLMERLRSGDENAFAEIYHLYAPSLTGFSSSKLSSLEEARDMIHDVFVYLWIERETIHIQTSLKSYLFGITRHKIIDHIRKNITREEYSLVLQRLDSAQEESIEKGLAVKDLGKIINEVVGNLPPRTKEIYQLSRIENKSISEISDILHLSNQTVKNQLTSALKFLRSSLSKLSIILISYIFLS